MPNMTISNLVFWLTLAAAIRPIAGHADAMSDAVAAADQIEAETRTLMCANEGMAAELIMLKRQSGESPTDVISETSGSGGIDAQKAV